MFVPHDNGINIGPRVDPSLPFRVFAEGTCLLEVVKVGR